MRQYLQCHVLKRTGRTMPQLQKICAGIKLVNRRNRIRSELFLCVRLVNTIFEFLLGKVGEIFAEYEKSTLAVCLIGKSHYLVLYQHRYSFRNEQAALRRKTLLYRLRRAYKHCFISCTLVLHDYFPSFEVS